MGLLGMAGVAVGVGLASFSTTSVSFQQLRGSRGIANIHLVAAVRKTVPGR